MCPLVCAIRINQPVMVQELLRFYLENGVPINSTNRSGYTALHVACSEQNLDERILTGLLKFPGIDVCAQNSDGNTPLHCFCEKFSSPMCQEYVDIFLSMGADINSANNFGETLLHKACLNSSIRLILVNILIERKADVNRLNKNGESPLHFAVRLNRDDILTVLLNAGADVTIRERRSGKTPCELARNGKIRDRLKKVEEMWKWLESLSPDIYEAYRTLFVVQELYLDVLPQATEKMLSRIGVKPIHCAAIMEAIKVLNEKQKAEKEQKETPKAAEKAESPEPQKTPANWVSDDEEEKSPSGEEEKENPKKQELVKKIEMAHDDSGNSWIINSDEIEFVAKAGKSKEKKRLGEGTSGTVYRAIYRKQDVAVKIWKPLEDESQIAEFEKEFKVTCALQGPFIVRFYGACIKPRLSLVMEFCERDTLYEVLNNPNNEIGWESVFRWAEQYAIGMKFLHNFKPQVLHRDFKSLNILMTANWECRICDFGLSRFNTQECFWTLKEMRGTFTHMAPELCPNEDGDKRSSKSGMFTSKADIYSMGIVFWELVLRCVLGEYKKPWFSEYPNFAAPGMEVCIIIKARDGARPTMPVGDFGEPKPGTVPPCVEEFYKKVVAQDPDSRPDAEQFLEGIKKLEEEFKKNRETWNKFITPPPEGKTLEKTVPDEKQHSST